jgi:hypothetical protein
MFLKDPILCGSFCSLIALFLSCLSSYPLQILSIQITANFLLSVIAYLSKDEAKSRLKIRLSNPIGGIIVVYLLANTFNQYKEYRSEISWRDAVMKSLSGNFFKRKLI